MLLRKLVFNIDVRKVDKSIKDCTSGQRVIVTFNQEGKDPIEDNYSTTEARHTKFSKQD